jgi:hypothetical protein
MRRIEMKNKVIAMVLTASMLAASITGCARESERVSYNVSQEADNFNVIRRLVVINARTDKPMFELVGAFSFEVSDNRIIAIAETGKNEYKKHSVGLTDWTLWSVEDLGGANVDKYRYEVNFLPEAILPVKFTSKD